MTGKANFIELISSTVNEVIITDEDLVLVVLVIEVMR